MSTKPMTMAEAVEFYTATPAYFENKARAEHRDAFLAGLRDVLEFFEAHPEIDPPSHPSLHCRPLLWWTGSSYRDPMRWGNWGHTKGDERKRVALGWLRTATAGLRRGAPIGAVRKLDNDYDLGVMRMFGPIEVRVAIDNSDVCEIRPVLNDDGTPKVEARTKYVAAGTEDVPVTEKVCPPFLTDAEVSA